MELLELVNLLQNSSNYPAVLATLVQVEGSSYRRVGARLLITSDGGSFGAISGGCLEADIIEQSLELLRSNRRSKLVTYDSTQENDLVWGIGTGCHGLVHIFLESLHYAPSWVSELARVDRERIPTWLATRWRESKPDPVMGSFSLDQPELSEHSVSGLLIQKIQPRWHLVIFGAGADITPLINIAHNVGWRSTVIDPRPEKAKPDTFPSAEEVICQSYKVAVPRIKWDDRTLAVIMTHNFENDRILLGLLLPMRLTFLGLLGPKDRQTRLLKRLGISDNDPSLESLHNPVGLDLGGDGAEAVALSIVAEIQATIHTAGCRPLRELDRPIHG